jgi:hypothetical protein
MLKGQVVIPPPLCLVGMAPHFLDRGDALWPAAKSALIISPIEFSPDPSDIPHGRDRLALQMQHLLYSQKNRRFAFGLQFTLESCTVYMFDRSGAVYAPSFNYHHEAEKFCSLMAGLATENIEKAGFDPSMKLGVDGPCVDIWDSNRRNGKPKSYSITETIYRSANLIGQGTTIWRARLAGSSGSEFIIKDEWEEPSLMSGKEDEATLLKHIKLKGISFGVLDLMHGEQVRRTTGRKDVDSVLRNRGVDSIQRNRIRDADLAQRNRGVDSVQRNNGVKSVDVASDYNLLDRIHTRLLFKSPGTIKPLAKFSTRIELLNAFHDAVLGTHQLLICF